MAQKTAITEGMTSLAAIAPWDCTKQLREKLIQDAADTKDHIDPP